MKNQCRGSIIDFYTTLQRYVDVIVITSKGLLNFRKRYFKKYRIPVAQTKLLPLAQYSNVSVLRTIAGYPADSSSHGVSLWKLFPEGVYFSIQGVPVSNKVVTVEARLTASLYYCLCQGVRILNFCICKPVIYVPT